MRIASLLFVLVAIAALSACGGGDAAAHGEAAPPGPMPAPTFAGGPTRISTPRITGPRSTPIERSPSRVIQSMLSLAESGQWGEVVDRYYGEREKFRSRGDRDGLVQRFEGDWGTRLLEALRNANMLSPTVEPDGRAVFRDGEFAVFELHKHEDGRWTFHL